MKIVIVIPVLLLCTFSISQSRLEKKYPNFTQLIEKITLNTRIPSKQESLKYSSDILTGKGSAQCKGIGGCAGCLTVFDKTGDTATITKKMKILNVKLDYVTKKDSIGNCGCYYSYFKLNNQLFVIDTAFHQCRSYFDITGYVGKAENFNFISINSSPNNEDGYRNSLNNLHLFVQYDSVWQYHCFQDKLAFEDLIFCDIDKDQRLDYLISSTELNKEQSITAKNDSSSKYFNIKIITNKTGKWELMKNKRGVPYYIFIKADDFLYPDKFEIIDYTWLKRL